MAYILAISNQKGGVGKTTTTLNLGAALGYFRKRVLLVDFDPQSGLTTSLGHDPNSFEATIYQVLQGKVPISELILDTKLKNVEFIPANMHLSGAENELNGKRNNKTILRRNIQKLESYDYILIDCQPAISFLTVNALAAADRVIVPMQTHYLAFLALRSLIDVVNRTNVALKKKLQIRILRTMHDKRSLHERHISKEVSKLFPDQLLKTIIPKRVSILEAPATGQSILTYAKYSQAARAFKSLAKEIIYDTEKTRP